MLQTTVSFLTNVWQYYTDGHVKQSRAVAISSELFDKLLAWGTKVNNLACKEVVEHGSWSKPPGVSSRFPYVYWVKMKAGKNFWMTEVFREPVQVATAESACVWTRIVKKYYGLHSTSLLSDCHCLCGTQFKRPLLWAVKGVNFSCCKKQAADICPNSFIAIFKRATAITFFGTSLDDL